MLHILIDYFYDFFLLSYGRYWDHKLADFFCAYIRLIYTICFHTITEFLSLRRIHNKVQIFTNKLISIIQFIRYPA